MRSFIALDLPEDVLDQLERLQDNLQVGRSVPRENLHLTLVFLGEQPEEAVEQVHEALSSFAVPAFELSLAGTESFGGATPKIVAAGVAPNPGLNALHRKIRSTLHGAGFEIARERFRPHVTLSRIRRLQEASALARLQEFMNGTAGFRTEPFAVTQVTLYQSTLGHGPPVYDPLATYPLGPPA